MCVCLCCVASLFGFSLFGVSPSLPAMLPFFAKALIANCKTVTGVYPCDESVCIVGKLTLEF